MMRGQHWYGVANLKLKRKILYGRGDNMTEKEYEAALARVEEIMDLDPKPDTELANELKALVLPIVEYEDIHYPLEQK